jgi:inosine-uridine nucleoside N-ribohydrolase
MPLIVSDVQFAVPSLKKNRPQIPVYVGCHEGLVHKHVYTDRFHGFDGFNDVHFEQVPTDEPENPIIHDEPAAQAMIRLVKQYPGM